MRGLRRRIEAIIEDVNHEIRVDLGLEKSLPELVTPDTLDMVEELQEIEKVDTESEEAQAFGMVLDEISERYEKKIAEIEEEFGEELEVLEEVRLENDHIY